MKRIIAVLSAVLMLSSLCACGRKSALTADPHSGSGTEAVQYDPESPQQCAAIYGRYLLDLGDNIMCLQSLDVTVSDENGTRKYDMSGQMDDIAEMISKVKITLATDGKLVPDADEYYTFTLTDGSVMTYHFNSGCYCVEGDQAIYGDAVYMVQGYEKPQLNDLGADTDKVQYAYNAVIDGIVDINDTDENRGAIMDFFGTGVKQMVLAYTPDNRTMYAGIYIYSGGNVVRYEKEVAPVDECAVLEIYPGWYGEDEETPCFYVIYTLTENGNISGSVTGYSIKGDEISECYSRSFADRAQWLDIAGDFDISLGACACDFGGARVGTPIGNLRVS